MSKPWLTRRSLLAAGGSAIAGPALAGAAGTPSAASAATAVRAGSPSSSAPAIASTATAYVATDGSDANSGASWQQAKATIDAAIATLPQSPDGRGRAGIVEIGAGTFPVTSSHRTDGGCTVAAGALQTVLDPHIGAADLGALVVGSVTPDAQPGIPGFQIIAVDPGVSFTLDAPATGHGSGLSFTIIRPGVYVPAGVTLRGRGRAAATGVIAAGNTNWVNTYSATLVRDVGTDVTIAFQTGAGEGGGDPTAISAALRDLSVWGPGGSGAGAPGSGPGSGGNGGNTIGVWTKSMWYLLIDNCDISQHGVWGLVYQGQGIAMARVSNAALTFNGSYAATDACGGFFQTPGAALSIFDNVSWINNYGCDVLNGNGTFLSCTTAQVVTVPGWSGAANGVPFYINASALDGVVNIWGCWFEGGAASQLWLTGNQVAYSVRGCLFQGASSGAPVGITLNAQASVQDCAFQGHATTSILLVNNSTTVLQWSNCYSSDPLFVSGVAGSQSIAAPQALGPGVAGAAGAGASPITGPPVALRVALVSGVAWQNTTGSDVILAVPIKFAAGGSAVLARGPHAAAAVMGTVTKAAADGELYEYYVPAGWDFEVTLSSGTAFAANATAQPV